MSRGPATDTSPTNPDFEPTKFSSRRGGCAIAVAACGDQACSWSVVHSWQATVAGPWPPVGGCALARPGMRTSPVSTACNLQTHWLNFCALAGAQGSLHGDQTWLGMLSRCATHRPQHQWSIGGIPFAPWVGAQALILSVQTLSSLQLSLRRASARLWLAILT